jgi:hypothetical protein
MELYQKDRLRTICNFGDTPIGDFSPLIEPAKQGRGGSFHIMQTFTFN